MKESGAKVLCVEDDPEYLALIVGLLADSGSTVVSCETVESALGILSIQAIQLILLDLHLPGKGGLYLLDELARSTNWKVIPVIILSGGEAQPLVQFPQVVAWISKSTGARELHEKISNFVKSNSAV